MTGRLAAEEAAGKGSGPWRATELSGKDAVFDLQDLTRGGVDQQCVAAVAYPLVSGGRHFQGEQPVIRQNVGRSPVRARQDFTVAPTVRCPTRGTVIRPDLEAARGLEVVLIGAPIHGGRSGVPAMW